MRTVILGKRSNLTSKLKKTFNNPIILSKQDIFENKTKKLPKKFNLIINTFHPSNQLTKINSFQNFLKIILFLYPVFWRRFHINELIKLFIPVAHLYMEI